MAAPQITLVDRSNGTTIREPFWPALTWLAKRDECPAYVIRNVLLDGQEWVTAGFAYRLEAADAAKVREAIRECSMDAVAMS